MVQEDWQKKIAERLKSLREERNLLGKEVALAIGVKYSTYSNWETGNRVPELSSFVKLCQFYNVSKDFLLGDTDKRASVPIASNYLGPQGADIDIEDNLREIAQEIDEFKERILKKYKNL